MNDQQKQAQLKYGFKTKEGVEIINFENDSEGYLWFERTGEVESIESRNKISELSSHTGGNCIDTAEYISPAAELAQGLISEAPAEASLAIIGISSAVGTRTWTEEVTVSFYN